MSQIRAVVCVDASAAPESAGSVLDRVRHALTRHGGIVSPTEGPTLFASFGGATGAVAAAVAAQQAVADLAGARIGIDIGEIAGNVPDADTTVAERAAALARRGPPGQVLLTRTVHDLARVDAGVTLAVTAAGPEEMNVDVYEARWESAARLPRVVVADDAGLIRSGVVQLLEASGFEVVGEAEDYDGLVATVDRTRPDLVVTDIRMPPHNTDEGLRAAAEIRGRHPGVAILVLSQHVEARAAAELLDGRPAGVGYVLKERVSDLDEFLDVCNTVAGGGSIIDPVVAERLVAVGGRQDALSHLTGREREVLDLMAEGSSNSAIAEHLHVGSKTVETHIRSIFLKLDLEETPEGHRRVQAVLRWLQG